jgi:hypothetical protein
MRYWNKGGMVPDEKPNIPTFYHLPSSPSSLKAMTAQQASKVDSVQKSSLHNHAWPSKILFLDKFSV